MEYLRVTNWSRFQHYKYRSPPWIKLHFDLLTSPDWVALSDASRVLAIACMLIASRNDGMIPANVTYFRRVAHLNQNPNFKPLIECGFLQCASNTLADASNLHSNAIPESESESEKRTTTTTTADSENRPMLARGKFDDEPEPLNGHPVAFLPLNDGSEFAVTESAAAELEKLYPAVDTQQTLNEIRGWALANPPRRKTKAGIMRHVHSWFAKEQNKP